MTQREAKRETETNTLDRNMMPRYGIGECWTCMVGCTVGDQHPQDLYSHDDCEAHRAAGHDVREMKP